MTERTVLVTGANGGIGRALCEYFSMRDWRVLATDLQDDSECIADDYVAMDLSRAGRDEAYRKTAVSSLIDRSGGELDCLINNAAVQRVAPFESLTDDDVRLTFEVNVVAPLLLTRDLVSVLQRSRGSVVNIASVHSVVTKPGFSAYAASKSALAGLTKALAVDVGSKVRVNAIAPSAIATSMLEAGFADRPEVLDEVRKFHPTGSIGAPVEVARLAYFLASADSPFLNGAVIGLDGGIAGRLHDPV